MSRAKIEKFLGCSIPSNIPIHGTVTFLEEKDVLGLVTEREDALFIRKAVIIENDTAMCISTMTVTEEHCKGHMPGILFLPLGVAGWIISQAGALLAAWLYGIKDNDHIAILETAGDPPKGTWILPGDRLVLIAELTEGRRSTFVVNTEARIGEEQVVVLPNGTYAVMTPQLLQRFIDSTRRRRRKNEDESTR